MRRKPLPGKHDRRLGHARTLNSMPSSAILSPEPTRQRRKSGLIGLWYTCVPLGDAVPKPLGFIALCQKHGSGEGDVPQRQRRPCPWTVAALGMLAGRAGSQTPRRAAALRAERIALGVPTCPPRRRMEYTRDRGPRKETSHSKRQVGGQPGRWCRSSWNTDRLCSSCFWHRAENPRGPGTASPRAGRCPISKNAKAG